MAAFGHCMARLNIHHHTDHLLLLLLAQDRRLEIELQVVVLFAPLLHLGDEVETGVGQANLFVCQLHQPTFVQPHMVDIPGCTGRLLRHQVRDLVDNRVMDAQRQRGLNAPRGGLHVETQMERVLYAQPCSHFFGQQHLVDAKRRRRHNAALLLQKIEHKAPQIKTLVVEIAHCRFFIPC